MPFRRNAAFTLIELTLVVLVLGLLAAAVFRYKTNADLTRNNAALAKTLDVIETSLQNYRNANTRLPCPADITLAENNTAFGFEAGSSGDGTCGNGTTTPNFINSGTDPDNADTNFAGGAPSYIVAGGVPTKTLRLDDKYAYDPWGRKILLVVDKRATATSAFTTYTVSNTTIGGIVIKRVSTDALANAVTTKGIYALVSFGANGHGAYVRNNANASTVLNAGITNTNSLKNCHCTNAAVATAFDRIFVQIPKTQTTTLTDIFDDVVRFKTRLQMANYTELQ